METLQSGPLRFAVLCDSELIEAWQLAALDRLENSGAGQCVALVVRTPGQAKPKAKKRRRITPFTLYNLYSRGVRKRCTSNEAVSLAERFPEAARINAATERLPRARTAIAANSLAEIERLDLDFAIRLGFGILSGEMLSLPRYGVWSYHHGDPSEYRGQPPGVWEIINGAETTGAIVQRLNETLDGGSVLASATFPTCSGSYVRQLDNILWGSVPMLTWVAFHCRANRSLPAYPVEGLGPIYKKPRTADTFRLLARMAYSRIANVLASLFRHQHWSFSVVRKDVRKLITDGATFKVDELIEGADTRDDEGGYFAADPFIANSLDGDEIEILFERYRYRTGKGHIASVTHKPGEGFSPASDVLTTSGHLSYPFVYEWAGERMMIPESLEDGELKVYPLAEKSQPTEASSTLGVAALDPTILHRDGRYWMFYCGDDRNTELCIRFASQIEGPWTEHPANPVKIDVRNSRPAGGILAMGDELIRPAQICVPRYGQGVVFNRIVRLNELEFREEPVASIVPATKGRFRNGVHTVSATDDVFVIDHARVSFSPWEALREIQRKFRKLFVGRGA